MAINGLPKDITIGELRQEIAKGARIVMFQYTVSILIMTFKRGTDLYYLRPGESAVMRGMPYTILTLFVGWWGFPWGPIYTLMCVVSNLGGGLDKTSEVMDRMARS